MQNSHIEWTDHTFNPWWGCMKVSAGCKNCYADTLDNRYNHDNPHWGPGSSRKPMSESYWKQPYKWNAAAKEAGVRAKVFCASMADVFEGHPDVIVHRMRLFTVIMETPHLDWLLLTKRPDNIMRYTPRHWWKEFPDNVWIGTSVENQESANERIPHLLKVPAKVRFLSCEPLLGSVDLTKIRIGIGHTSHISNVLTGITSSRIIDGVGKGNLIYNDGDFGKIHWVIAGGESGHNSRAPHPDWFRGLRDQCAAAGTAFFFKQWGEYAPGEKGRLYRLPTIDFTDGQPMVKVGKKTAGSLLDGVEHKHFPLLNTV